MKFRQAETSLDLSSCSQRVTRSSSESVHSTKLIKKIPKATQNNYINSKKGRKLGKTLTESYSKKEANFIPLDDIGSKRYTTRSSFGSINGLSLKNPKLTTEPETKSSKRLNKPNKTQLQKDFGKAKNSKQLASSIPVSTIDVISPVLQTAVKGKKAKPVVSKKKSNVVISSESQSTGDCQKSKSVVVGKKSSVPKGQTRVTCSSLGNAVHSPSTCEKNTECKLSAPVVQPTEDNLKVQKRHTSKEKLSLEDEDSKRKTRSSLAKANSYSVMLRNKSPRCKLPNKPSSALPNPGELTKKKSISEKKNLGQATKNPKRLKSYLREDSDSSSIAEGTSESMSVVSPSAGSSPKKAQPKQISPHAQINSVKLTNTRNTRLSASVVLATPITSSLGTGKRSASCQSGISSGKRSCDEELKDTPIDCLANISPRPTVIKKSYKISNAPFVIDKNSGECKHNLNALETEEKIPTKVKMPRVVKRKSNTPPAIETKRKKKTLSITPASTKDPVSSSSTLTDGESKKPTRRHTDVLPKTKRTTPDISMLPLDSISTLTTKRPKSAPAAIKKQSLSKDLNSTIPKKGTLKRKRWLTNALKEKNKCYEDDIFENQKFASPFRSHTEADDESDTSIATPKFGFFLTPAVAKRTPKYKDIISPSDLVKARKNAEEYLYRRQNRNKKNKIITLKTPASSQTKAPTKLGQIPEKKKLEFTEAMDKIQTIKSTIEAKAAEDSDEDDDYFSDVSS